MVNGSYLRSGAKKDCGCINRYGNRFINLKGQKFGQLTVLEIAGRVEGDSYVWLVYLLYCNQEYFFPVNGFKNRIEWIKVYMTLETNA